MGLVPQRQTVETAPAPTGSGRRVERWFYISAGLFGIVLSLVGFGPSIVDHSRRNAPFTLLVTAHAIAVRAWLLLFLTQATLVATGRTRVRRRHLWSVSDRSGAIDHQTQKLVRL